MENNSHNPVDLMDREKEVVTPETIRQATRKLFDGIMRVYYHSFRFNGFTEGYMSEAQKAKEPADTEEALNMFLEIQKEINNSKLDYELSYNSGSWVYGMSYNEYLKCLSYTQSFLESAILFGEKALEIQAQENKSDKIYYTTLRNNTKKMNLQNYNVLDYVRKWDMFKKDMVVIFETAINDFSISTKNIRDFIEDIKKSESNNVNSATLKQERKCVPTPQVDPKEKNRIDAISRANSMYEEFCLDFMRDLEKQYALSSKDLYENFVNVKFKKFIEKYKMPLSNDVSEGYAREVIYQIQKLMNIVSEISANSYVTATYN